MPRVFQPQIAKKNNATSVRIIVVCSDPRLLWEDSDKVVDLALTSPEPLLHQIGIIIMT